MTFLPIVARELRVAARRRGTYWLRLGAALGVIVLGTWFFLVLRSSRESSRTIALALFYIMTGSATLSALLSGLRSTADCLSEEKREGTLGLLFLTDLRGYDVVLGKLASNSLNALYGLLAVVPMLAVPLLMGGIAAGEFWRMALVALNALFFSLAVGLGVSALSRSAQKARGMTMALLLLFAAGLPACGSCLLAWGKIRQPGLFMVTSPGVSYWLALDRNYALRGLEFWLSVAVVHGLGWLFLTLASLVAPRCWQDRPPGVQRLRWRERWQLWSYGGVAERIIFRRRLLEKNAFFWLAGRARLKPAVVWAVLGVLGGIWLWGLGRFRREWLDQGTYLVTALCLNFLLRGWLAGAAARQLAEDRRAGTLELLLSTPLSVPEILRGQLLALKRQFLGPVIVVVSIECLFMFAGASQAGSFEDRTVWFSVWLAGMAMFVADLFALYYVSLWQALNARNPAHAANAAVLRILILPWAGMAFVFLWIVLAAASTRSEPPLTWKFYLGLWFILGLAADLGFGFHAWHHLLTDFRAAAERRFTAPAGFWQRWLGRAPETGR